MARKFIKPTDLTPERRAHEAQVRRKYAARPGRAALLASGEYAPPTPLGEVFDVLELIAQLRQERQRRGLTLAEVSRRAGMPVAALSRLEAGRRPNPTVATLSTYAAAIGRRLAFTVQDEPTGAAS